MVSLRHLLLLNLVTNFILSRQIPDRPDCEVDNEGNTRCGGGGGYARGGGGGEEKGGCFAGGEVVTLEGGAMKLIEEVKRGDRVLSADSKLNLKFSEVISIPHGYNNIKAEFIKINLASGDSIRLTPDHRILMGSCDEDTERFIPIPASKSTTGSCAMTTGGKSEVMTIERVISRGFYTFLTYEEFIIVGNTVVSPFAFDHAFSHFSFGLYRSFLKTFPKVQESKIFNAFIDLDWIYYLTFGYDQQVVGSITSFGAWLKKYGI